MIKIRESITLHAISLKKKQFSILSKMEKAKADDEENKQYEIMMYKNKYIFGLHLHSWHRAPKALGIS